MTFEEMLAVLLDSTRQCVEEIEGGRDEGLFSEEEIAQRIDTRREAIAFAERILSAAKDPSSKGMSNEQ